ncbi:hypothetical protein LRC484719_20670 [Mycobacterium riyadhense]
MPIGPETLRNQVLIDQFVHVNADVAGNSPDVDPEVSSRVPRQELTACRTRPFYEQGIAQSQNQAANPTGLS